jgi:polyphenol oxidase
MKIIKSKIFEKFPELKFGISTKNVENSEPPFYFNLSYRIGDKPESVKKNRGIFFNELGINEKQVSFQRQTHSVNSNFVTHPAFFEDSDALYTNTKNNFLAVSIADCIPVFLYESEKKIVAAIHSGWKGTLNKITTVTIEKLAKDFSFNVKKAFVFIGPGISIENFEVSNDVAVLFDENVKTNRDGKYFIDLKKHNYRQLVELGVKIENIEVSEHCTFKEKDLFHSYRQDREKAGRMLGVIGII